MIPPHNPQAEADALGSALLNRQALEHVLGTLTADDFYVPAHAAVFRAIVAVVKRGEGPDATTLAAELHARKELDLAGGRGALIALSRDVPASMNAPAYAALVADCAARRRLLSLAERVSGQAMDPEQRVEEILAGFAGTVETIPLSFEVPGTVEAGDLIAEPDDFDWLVPNWIERGDRILWTAAEGVGKSEMQLQLAVMLAAGIHPFQRHNVRRLRVLLVDLENSRRQLRRRIRRLIAAAGDRYQGGLTVWPRIDGINLRDPRDFRALDALCEKHHPELVVLGPLYKAFRTKGGERVTEETPAQEAAQALDRLRARHGCALSIEAHAPHGDHGDREGLRPYGASLWLRWPEFGIGMKRLPGERSVELKHWRGARDRDRDWPEVLAEGRLWPWEPIERSAA